MADADDKKPQGHSLADHLYGENLAHEHDEYTDHDHDHFEFDDDGPIELNPIWQQDHVTLVSVGIDIGSAGTQVIFSRINLRRYGEDLTSRYYVVSRETLYQSPNALTPYQSEELIDEALRRENSAAIARILSEQGGEFVCATAGHHMESMLAAYGSGASRVSHDEDKRILNIDIGGGTTKLSVVEKGHVVATAAFHVGGRLQVVDDKGMIARLDPAGRYHARQAGFDWRKGDVIDVMHLDKVADVMADEVVAALTQRPMSHAIEHLYLTDPILEFGRIDGIMV